jgi:hypothetical protein
MESQCGNPRREVENDHAVKASTHFLSGFRTLLVIFSLDLWHAEKLVSGYNSSYLPCAHFASFDVCESWNARYCSAKAFIIALHGFWVQLVILTLCSFRIF